MDIQKKDGAQENVLNKGAMVSAIMEMYPGDFQSAAAADRIVRGIFKLMADQLASGGTVRIQDFGTFEVQESKARTGRNPATKEPIEIPASQRIKFRAAAALKAAANT